jgi:formylmethanofuran dehydrogenase subunit E
MKVDVDVEKNNIKETCTIACDNCGKLLSIEQLHLVPEKNLCTRCLVGFYFSEWYSRIYQWKRY